MMTNWTATDTTTHQDHVIAHVIGATLFGHFVWDETAYLLLDIGFVWNIYLDGEMGLLPHPVVIAELDADEIVKNELREDIESLLAQHEAGLTRMTVAAIQTPIQTVDFWTHENSRRLVLTCEQGSVVIETSLDSGEVRIMIDDNNESELVQAAQAETEFVRQRLRTELGRDPTEEELNEWLREHTESY
jgi:hypothetical protein